MIGKDDDVIKNISGGDEIVPREVNNTSRFMKLAGLAIGSYYLSKKEPEAFKSFSEEIKRQQTVSEDSERDIAKDTAKTIAGILTKNQLDRKKRYDTNFASIDVLTDLGLKPVFAAKAAEDGYGSQLIALKKKYPNLVLNNVYKGLDKLNIPGYTTTDFANILTGKMTKPNIDYSKYKSTPSAIEKFLGFNTDKNFSDDIKRRVGSQDTSGSDLSDDIYTKGKDVLKKLSLTEETKNLLANADAKGISTTRSAQDIAKGIESFMGVTVGISGENYTFEGKSEQNKILAREVTDAIAIQIEKELQANNLKTMPDTNMTRTSLRNKYINKYFGRIPITTTNKDGKQIITYKYEPKKNDEGDYLINELGIDKNIIPRNWTKTSTESEQVILPKSKEIANEIARHKRKINAIKSNQNLTQTQKDKKIKAAEKEHKDKLDAIKSKGTN